MTQEYKENLKKSLEKAIINVKNKHNFAKGDIILTGHEKSEYVKVDIQKFSSLLNPDFKSEEYYDICEMIYNEALPTLVARPAFSFSIKILFGIVEEYIQMVMDRDTITANRDKVLILKKEHLQEEQKNIEEDIHTYKSERNRLMMKDSSSDDGLKKQQQLRLKDIEKILQTLEERKRQIHSELIVTETNIGLKYFTIAESGNSFAQVHTQLMKKKMDLYSTLDKYGFSISKKNLKEKEEKGTSFKDLLSKYKDTRGGK